MTKSLSTEETLPPVFTPASLAERWDCSERHIRNLISSGELRCFRLGKKLFRIRRQDVENFEQGSAVSEKIDVEIHEGDQSPVVPQRKQRAARLDKVKLKDVSQYRSDPLVRAKINSLRRSLISD